MAGNETKKGENLHEMERRQTLQSREGEGGKSLAENAQQRENKVRFIKKEIKLNKM